MRFDIGAMKFLHHFLFVLDGLEVHHRQVTAPLKVTGFIQHIGNAAGHAGSEVTAGLPENNDNAACHVFTPVVARTFDDGNRPRIAHSEPFAGNTTEITFAVYRAIQHGVADDHALIGINPGFRVWTNNQFAAREAFADIVIGFADEFQGHTLHNPGPETLPGNAFQLEPEGIVRQSGMPVFQRQLS